MAPIKTMKTYERQSTSIVNRSQAYNFFLKNTAKKGIKKRKKAITVKVLPARKREESALYDSGSLHLNKGNDPFDEILKSDKYNKIVFKTNIFQTADTTNQYLTRKSTKKLKDISNQSQSLLVTNDKNLSNTVNTFLKQYFEKTTPSKDRITNSLEIEKASRQALNFSLSYIKPSKENNLGKFEGCFDPFFSNTFREMLCAHSSTPLVPLKNKRIINNTISPITNVTSNKSMKENSNLKCSSSNKLLPSSSFITLRTGRNNNSRITKKKLCLCEHSYSNLSLKKKSISLQSEDISCMVDSNKENKNCMTQINQSDDLFISQDNYEKQDSISLNMMKQIFFTQRQSGKLLLAKSINCEDNPVKLINKFQDNSSRTTYDNFEKSVLNSTNNFSLLEENNCHSEDFLISVDENATHDIINNSDKKDQYESNFSTSKNDSVDEFSVLETEQSIIRNENENDSSDKVFSMETINLITPTKSMSSKTKRSLTLSLLNSFEDNENVKEIKGRSSKENSSRSDKLSKKRDNHSQTDDELFLSESQNSETFSLHGSFEEKEKFCSKPLDVRLTNIYKDNLMPKDKKIANSKKKFYNLRSRTKKDSIEEDVFSGYSNSPSESEVCNKSLKIILTRLQLEENCESKSLNEESIHFISEQEDKLFKLPTLNQPKIIEPPLLKPGKLWRRSLSLYKKKNEDLDYATSSCFNRKSDRMTKRLTIKFVPVENFSERQDTAISILESYALNSSYVSDQILEENLENSFRSLSLSKRKQSVIQDSAPVTAREVVLRRCGQTEPLPFSECYPESALRNCQKIGEGVYGEVFLFRNPNGGTSVMKVIPIEGDLIVNGERQKKFEEILSEIIIAMELSNLRKNKTNTTSSFSDVQTIQCVRGSYPDKLLDLWELYDETRNSENDSPKIFDDNQLYIVLQLANGGSDLESYVFNNAVQSYAMIQQVALALAVAEEELQFEHRDLHWGNVLLSTVDRNKKVSYRLNGKFFDIPTKGVEVTIIDFTLSRIECDDVMIFNDLSQDPDLFTAEGDYQFEIYRLMQKKNGDNWQRFEPYTNILWLHYTLDKAITALHYKNRQSKLHKEYLAKLKQLQDEILTYPSIKEFVLNNF